MPTIKKNILDQLEQRGLWPDEAETVFQRMADAPENNIMQNRWNDQMEDYPSHITVLAWIQAKRHAVAYIDEVKPKHWARAMFVN